jgi:hypothetical protein
MKLFTARQPDTMKMMAAWNDNVQKDMVCVEKYVPSTPPYKAFAMRLMKFGLLIISAAGYGYPFSREGSESIEPDHHLCFKDSHEAIIAYSSMEPQMGAS